MTIVVTWPFVVTAVVNRLVPPFEPGCDPQASPAPRPAANRDTVSVSRIASQLRLRRIKRMLVVEGQDLRLGQCSGMTPYRAWRTRGSVAP